MTLRNKLVAEVNGDHTIVNVVHISQITSLIRYMFDRHRYSALRLDFAIYAVLGNRMVCDWFLGMKLGRPVRFLVESDILVSHFIR